MPKTIAFVSCVKTKRDIPLPAKNLYISPFFKKTSAYAQCVADEWYILSAKYGLVFPEQVIEPYELTLNNMPVSKRMVWAEYVLQDITKVINISDRIIFLAGVRYREFLVGPIAKKRCIVEIPMEGLGFGQQLRWLKERLEVDCE